MTPHLRRRGGVAVLAAAVLLNVTASASPARSSLSGAAVTGAATRPPALGTFTPVGPVRILDTRDGTGRNGITTRVGPGQTITADVTGVGGVPASGVSAVVMNVTVTEPTSSSYLTLHPGGIGRPLASNLNFSPGQTVPNLVVVAVGANGTVSAYNNLGGVHVIFDVVGWFGGGGSQAQGAQRHSEARATPAVRPGMLLRRR